MHLFRTASFKATQFQSITDLQVTGGMGLEQYKTEDLCLINKINAFEKYVFNPIALRKAKIVCNFGLSECNRVRI